MLMKIPLVSSAYPHFQSVANKAKFGQDHLGRTNLVGGEFPGGFRNSLAELPYDTPFVFGRGEVGNSEFPVHAHVGDEPKVSRQHFTLIRKPQGWLVIDGVILNPGDKMPALSQPELTNRVIEVEEMPGRQIVRSLNGVWYQLPGDSVRVKGLTQILGPESHAEEVDSNDWTRMQAISWVLPPGTRIKIGRLTEFTLP